MLGTQKLRGLSLVSLFLVFVLVPIVAAAQDDTSKSCPWYCRIEKKLQELQEQIDTLYALLLPKTASPNNSPHSDPGYSSEVATTLAPQYTIPFGTPSTTATAIPTFDSPSSLPAQPSFPTPTMHDHAGYRSVAYFVNWGIYGRKYPPQKIPSDKLTHILYAFGDNRDDGTVFLTDKWSDTDIHYEGDSWNDVGNNLYGNLKQLNLQKQTNRNLKVLLSIGGWTYTNVSKHFDGPASTAQGRKRFADSCVELIRDLGFDGIDLDWEYPQNEEQGRQLLELLREIRNAMEAYADELAGKSGGERPRFVLSIAAPAGKSNYGNLPLGEIGDALDFINLMGYDFSGSWDAVSGHGQNLYHSSSCPSCTPFNIQTVIDDYTAAGVAPSKIVLGMPLYGRAFLNTKGIGQPFQGVGAPDQDNGSWEGGVWDYKALPRPGASEHIDEEAGASYSYDNSTGMLVSYDTLDMAKRKAEYIKQQGLGGGMWWELSGDRQDEGSIVANVVRELGGHDGGGMEHQRNWLQFPDSQYENLRKGFQ